MIQIVKKWQIILYFDLSEKSIELFIYDNFYSNMLKKLQEVHFSVEPTNIEIKLINQNEQEGVSHQ